MENDNTTQPQVEDTQKEVTVETQTTTANAESKKEVEKTYTQADFDKAMADTRRATEKETKRQLLAKAGLKSDEEEKLGAYKEAYENSLSDEEKRNTLIEDLQADNIRLTQETEDKDYIIKALTELTGKNEDDVEKIVKMAKGLKTEDNTIEDAIKEVISMINVEPTNPATVVNPDIPKGQEIQQPSTIVQVNTQENPFKAETINLTKQGELIKNNPELAKKLAGEAGIRLNL